MGRECRGLQEQRGAVPQPGGTGLGSVLFWGGGGRGGYHIRVLGVGRWRILAQGVSGAQPSPPHTGRSGIRHASLAGTVFLSMGGVVVRPRARQWLLCQPILLLQSQHDCWTIMAGRRQLSPGLGPESLTCLGCVHKGGRERGRQGVVRWAGRSAGSAAGVGFVPFI